MAAVVCNEESIMARNVSSQFHPTDPPVLFCSSRNIIMNVVIFSYDISIQTIVSIISL